MERIQRKGKGRVELESVGPEQSSVLCVRRWWPRLVDELGVLPRCRRAWGVAVLSTSLGCCHIDVLTRC
jgi:hypothetical protein